MRAGIATRLLFALLFFALPALGQQQINLATQVRGTLPVANGGTGNTSGTATTNANLTGPITSSGNATAVGAGSLVTFTSGTSRTLANAAEIVICTVTSTVTPPASATAGMQFCVQNDDNVATVITLAAVTNVQYEATARTSYGTANHTMTSGGAVKDQMCMVAISTTKCNTFSSVGTWTNN